MPGHPGQVALAAFARDAPRSAFVTDFDGTLAPIVNDPANAVPLPRASDALAVLARRLGLVAVVSGRPVSFLRDRLSLDGIVLVGQYGLERLVDGEIVVDSRATPYLDAVAAAADEAEATWPELLVERKGAIAFTVHWRTSPGFAPAAAALTDLAARHGLAPQPGRMACELRPPVPVDKGDAVKTLLDEGSYPTAVAFAGDDLGDLVVFDMFDELSPRADEEERWSDPSTAYLRITVRSSEAPPELIERADIVVDGPAGLADLLADLVSSLPPEPA